MKRNEAISYVLNELKDIKQNILNGKSISPLKFLELSEIFKFRIDPLNECFDATCLIEAAKNNNKDEHLKLINDILDETEDDEENEDDEKEEEVTELVDYDGSVMSSKIPAGTTNNKTISSKKTTDDVVPATRQSGTWSSAGHYFKRYWGESIEEIGETDKSVVLGVEETEQMDFDEAVDYYVKELEMDEEEALDRVSKERGPKSLEKEKSDGSFTRQRITEKEKFKSISEDKARKMIEVILNTRDESGEIAPDSILNKKIKQLSKLAKAEGITDLNTLIDKIKVLWDE